MMSLTGPLYAHILWIGGAPCSGKTSLSERLSETFGLKVYHCNDAFPAHVKRVRPEAHPTMARLREMTWDDLWMRPVDEQVTDELAAYREEFDMILTDLRSLPRDEPIIAEGTALLPDLVMDVVSDPRQAIWLIPGGTFQRDHYMDNNDRVQAILDQCTNPAQAFENWMARDELLAEWVAASAHALKLTVLTVTGSRTIDQNAEIVANHFGLAVIDDEW